jgi:hypothetical protein
MEALCSSDVSADLCQTTRRDSPQDGNLHSDRCENLKCHTLILISRVSFCTFVKKWFMNLTPVICTRPSNWWDSRYGVTQIDRDVMGVILLYTFLTSVLGVGEWPDSCSCPVSIVIRLSSISADSKRGAEEEKPFPWRKSTPCFTAHSLSLQSCWWAILLQFIHVLLSGPFSLCLLTTTSLYRFHRSIVNE